MSPVEEKAFFLAAMKISNGFYLSQTNTLDIFQYTMIASILDYISELEISFSDKITGEILRKAV